MFIPKFYPQPGALIGQFNDLVQKLCGILIGIDGQYCVLATRADHNWTVCPKPLRTGPENRAMLARFSTHCS